MAATISGVSTLGIILSYAVETTSGQKPSAFTALDRINAISGIELSTETIDASALEDLQERSIAGRQSTGGEWSFTINATAETITEVEAMMAASATGLASNLRTWFQVYSPNLSKAWFVVAQPGSKIPMPDFSQNELLTCDISLTVDEYIGIDTKIPASGAANATTE